MGVERRQAVMKKINVLEPKQPALAPRKRVAAYARVSMDTERLKHSLSAQISYPQAGVRAVFFRTGKAARGGFGI